MSDCPVNRPFPPEVFHFSGQSSLEAWTLHDLFERFGWNAYDRFLSHEPELCLQRIRDLVDAFPTYQRRAATGRPATDERVHLMAALLRQFFQASIRSIESHLRILKGFLRLSQTPDANTLSRMNRSRRFTRLLRRFHAWLLGHLPSRKAVVAVDATGFSNRKRPWSVTSHALRAHEDWIKIHAAVEIPTLFIVGAVATESDVHESRVFDTVLQSIHPTLKPVRTLADAAYAGETYLEASHTRGATPLHRFRSNAIHRARPTTRLQKLVNFATHWPNRYHHLTARRALVETAFHAQKQRFGHQVRCRHPVARRNEILAKQVAHNTRILIMRLECVEPGF